MSEENKVMTFDEAFPHTQSVFTVPEIARLLGVDKNTIDKWCKQLKIRISYVGGSRLRTIRRHQVKKLFERKVWNQEVK